MAATFTESVVEDSALAWLEAAGWRVAHGPAIAPETSKAERQDDGVDVLAPRLRDVFLTMRKYDELRMKDAEAFLTGTAL